MMDVFFHLVQIFVIINFLIHLKYIQLDVHLMKNKIESDNKKIKNSQQPQKQQQQQQQNNKNLYENKVNHYYNHKHHHKLRPSEVPYILYFLIFYFFNFLLCQFQTERKYTMHTHELFVGVIG